MFLVIRYRMISGHYLYLFRSYVTILFFTYKCFVYSIYCPWLNFIFYMFLFFLFCFYLDHVEEKVKLLWSLRLSSLSCKNFNVTDYSKSITCIHTKLGILAYHDKVQLQGKGHNSERYIFGVIPLFN